MQGKVQRERRKGDLTHPLICESKAIVSDDGTGGKVASRKSESSEGAVTVTIFAQQYESID